MGDTCPLEVIEGLLKQLLLSDMMGVTPANAFGHGVDDAPEYCWVDTRVALYDIPGGPGRHRSSPYLGQ